MAKQPNKIRKKKDDSNAIYNNLLWDALKKHFGHSVEIAVYGNPKDPADVCLECKDCNEVILDGELYTLGARTDIEQ